MPTPIPPLPKPLPPRPTPVPPTVTVRGGDTLGGIARRVLGDSRRWKELHELNRGVIGDDPARLRIGQVLRMPGQAAGPARQAPPAAPATPARPPARPADRDGDGLIDRYDAAPDNARDRRWSKQANAEFEQFMVRHTLKLSVMGVEIDCADFAVKMLVDFCKATGIPSPLGEKADRWQVYTPERTGGLPNVNGPNYFLPGIGADNLAKGSTRNVNDADGNGVAGWDRKTGQVDVADLRAGDILFYDWEGDGRVNHTVQVLRVEPDGTVLIAFGTYDNLAEDDQVDWQDLDLAPIAALRLTPGSADYEKYLGPDNSLWGVRRYHVLPDKEQSASIAYVPYVPPAPPPLPPVPVVPLDPAILPGAEPAPVGASPEAPPEALPEPSPPTS